MRSAKLIKLRSREEDLLAEVSRLSALVQDLQEQLIDSTKRQVDKAVLVYAETANRMVRVSDVVMIQADDNYSMIHLRDGAKMMTSRTLKHWQEAFNASELLRVHSSFLVNKHAILEINKSKMSLKLTNDLVASVSRSKRSVLDELK